MNDGQRRLAFVSGLEMSGYGIVRSLGRAGVPVFALTDGVEDFGHSSKYCRVIGTYSGNDDENLVCEKLVACGKSFPEKPVLFVTSDWFALLAARHQEELSPYYEFHWVPAETLACVTHKARIHQFCEQHDVLVARTHFTQPGEDLGRSARDFLFPCLVKVVRHFDRAALPPVDLLVFHSTAELLELYNRHPELRGKTLWQEIIEGDDDNVFECNVLIRKSGEAGGIACVRRLRQYPPRFGMMSYGRSEENESVIAETLRLLGLLDYRGLANVEFRYRPKDGRYYFIEMNPRLPWSTPLFTKAGVNLPYRAYLDLIGAGDDAFRARQEDGVYVLSFNHDAGWYARTRREREIGFWEWLRSMRKARAHAWWDWRDPKPGLRAALHLSRVALRKLLKRPNPAAKSRP